jgi:hypothetical protein
MVETKLVEVMPIEYCPRHRVFDRSRLKVRTKNPRLQIYWGYSLLPNLTEEIVKVIISHLKHKKYISIEPQPDGSIVWCYSGKPPIYLSRPEGKVFVSRGTLKRFGRKSCQQQASEVLRILKGTKKQPWHYASFKRISVTCDPERIGRTKEDRQIYFEAVMDLFNDKPKVRLGLTT